MSRDLVRESFRYANGQAARNHPIAVVLRGTNQTVPLFASNYGSESLSNPIITDPQGNVSFYCENGFYDFLALGARIPFDVEPDVEIGQQDLDSVVDLVEAELGETDLVLLWENAKAGA